MSAAPVPASSELAAGSGRLRGSCGSCSLLYESAADPVVARLCGAGALVWVGLVVRFVCVIRVPVCPCVPCVSRLPQVTFYRYLMATEVASTLQARLTPCLQPAATRGGQSLDSRPQLRR